MVEAVQAVVMGVEGMHPGAGECLNPGDVPRRDEMPRRPEGVGAQDDAIIERLLNVVVVDTADALADGPFRHRVLLRLHGAEVADHGGWLGQRRAGAMLVVQPAVRDLQSVHVALRRPCSVVLSDYGGRPRRYRWRQSWWPH